MIHLLEAYSKYPHIFIPGQVIGKGDEGKFTIKCMEAVGSGESGAFTWPCVEDIIETEAMRIIEILPDPVPVSSRYIGWPKTILDDIDIKFSAE